MTDFPITPSTANKKSSWLEPVRNIFSFMGQRLGFGLLVLVAIIFLSYFGLDMARGQAFGEALAGALPKTGSYIVRLVQGDLGMSTAITSTALPHDIRDMLPDILGKSFGLLAVSLLFAAVLGILLGVVAASRRQNSLTILLVSLIGISAPSFFVALL